MATHEHAPDSTPTPLTELSLSALAGQARGLAERARQLRRYDVEQHLGALVVTILSIPDQPPEVYRSRRELAVGMLHRLRDELA